MTNKTLHELAEYVQRTYEVDDSGDATIEEFLLDLDSKGERTDVRELFIGFLVWANGTKWEQFLDGAQVGDIPPKE